MGALGIRAAAAKSCPVSPAGRHFTKMSMKSRDQDTNIARKTLANQTLVSYPNNFTIKFSSLSAPTKMEELTAGSVSLSELKEKRI